MESGKIQLTQVELENLINQKVNEAMEARKNEAKVNSISYEGKELWEVELVNGIKIKFHSQDEASAKYRGYRIARERQIKYKKIYKI